MEMTLPPKLDGSRDIIDGGTRQITIIGANGAGKSRFTEALVNGMEGRAFRVSALHALYGKDAPGAPLPGSIDSLYAEAVGRATIVRNDAASQFDRLMGVLLCEEFVNLLSYKIMSATDSTATLQPTRLDTLIELWQEIFPDNRILLEGGRMLFSRNSDTQAYSSLRLSDGERAVLYYIGAALLAMDSAVIFVDTPGLFLHPSVSKTLWDRLEGLRPDCTFIYTTHDLEFAGSRTDNLVIWVRDYDAAAVRWDYDVLPPNTGLPDEVYLAIIGGRKPVLFIEGDDTHSIDSKLYPLVFKGYTVKALGSCNKVIETTRTFNDLKSFHHLDSHGIVDRDRRDEKEVAYLRRKNILVPEVAEIENLLMLEDVVKAVANHHRRNENVVFDKVRKAIIAMFKADIRQQALLHTRHKVKQTVEYRIDGRFRNINLLEEHITGLVNEINPRGIYEDLCREFHSYAENNDYRAILKVYNQKTMIQGSNVASLCGIKGSRDEYVKSIISILKSGGANADRIRRAITRVFGIDSIADAAADSTPKQQ